MQHCISFMAVNHHLACQKTWRQQSTTLYLPIHCFNNNCIIKSFFDSRSCNYHPNMQQHILDPCDYHYLLVDVYHELLLPMQPIVGINPSCQPSHIQHVFILYMAIFFLFNRSTNLDNFFHLTDVYFPNIISCINSLKTLFILYLNNNY